MERKQEKGRLFTPIKTAKISDELYKQILSLISSGRLEPAEKLPSEREIATDLGISRQSVREALYRAAVRGLIEVRQGEGSFVLSSVEELLKPPLVTLLTQQAERVFEFLEIRSLIEGWCAEKAAETAGARDLEKMQQLLSKMERLSPKDRKWEQTDMEFHFALVTATHNVIAIHIMEALKIDFVSFFDFRQNLPKMDEKDLLLKHHYEVYQAIKRGDASSAKKKILDHLDFIAKKIENSWKKSKSRSEGGGSESGGGKHETSE